MSGNETLVRWSIDPIAVAQMGEAKTRQCVGEVKRAIARGAQQYYKRAGKGPATDLKGLSDE